jgi:hypothetical protein
VRLYPGQREHKEPKTWAAIGLSLESQHKVVILTRLEAHQIVVSRLGLALLDDAVVWDDVRLATYCFTRHVPCDEIWRDRYAVRSIG